LGFNCIEKQALLGRCTLERRRYDYGIDAEMVTYSENGEIENGYILFQIKSTDNIKYLKDKQVFIFDLDKKDLEFWLEETNPFYLILYDAKADIAYTLDLQKYIQNIPNLTEFI